MIVTLLTLVHIIVCVFLVIVVLLQSGKAADLAGAFGGMGSQTAFGPRGSATLLSKATTIAAGLFMVTSLTLAILATRGSTSVGSSVLERQAPAKAGQTSPLPAGQPAKPGSPAGSITLGGEGQKPITLPLNVPQTGTAPAKPPAQQQQPAAPPKK